MPGAENRGPAARRYEERIECAADRATPARIQASTCRPEPREASDVYLFEGFKGNLTFLIQSDGREPVGRKGNETVDRNSVDSESEVSIGAGPKTMLRFEAKASSSSGLEETEVLFPATNGIILTTGNLQDLTAESGALRLVLDPGWSMPGSVISTLDA
eukprot:366956-Rhodomonas_salina.2